MFCVFVRVWQLAHLPAVSIFFAMKLVFSNTINDSRRADAIGVTLRLCEKGVRRGGSERLRFCF